ncbi:MAG: hypothetical protein ACREAM_13935, partial [Blastocatellia bacterium]
MGAHRSGKNIGAQIINSSWRGCGPDPNQPADEIGNFSRRQIRSQCAVDEQILKHCPYREQARAESVPRAVASATQSVGLL